MSQEEAEQELRDSKIQRRNAKGRFTRCMKSVVFLVDNRRPQADIEEAFQALTDTLANVQEKHELLVSKISEDEEYLKEEEWLSQIEVDFMRIKIMKDEYIIEKNKAKTKVMEQEEVPVQVEVPVQGEVPVQVEAIITGQEQNAETQAAEIRPVSHPRVFKIEKPQLPKFSGDVRDYLMFKADFKEFVETQYSAREAVTILRSSLSGKPLDLVRGLSDDYQATWGYLDAVYGDPKSIADAVAQDLMKFKSLKEGEDNRFCDLYHLVNRSFNLLKQAGRQYDMDNNHVLAMIEQKLSVEDRKVWFRQLEGDEATLKRLIVWMENEMKIRMRASAPIRSGNRGLVCTSTVASTERSFQNYKCWLCKSNSHWVDNCFKIKEMTPNQRLETMKENKACFSCLKKSAKGHNMSTCSRRKPCTISVNGEKCKYFHHPLLHQTSAFTGVAVACNQTTLLPVLSADVLGKGDRKRVAKVLFDSGAQVSIIRQELADSLKLRGQNISMTIAKVGGTEEVMNTKLYDVPIRSNLDGKVQMIKAVGIDHIAEDTSKVNVQELAKILKVDPRELRRESGTIDLLIGVDYSSLHMGMIKRIGGMVARKSDIGWVIFGGQKDHENDTYRVLNICISPTIDMSEFWSTEALGVRAPNCSCKPEDISPSESQVKQQMENSCVKKGKQWEMPYPWKKDPSQLPDNKSQAQMKLANLEKRLMRNPEQAKQYDRQIEEMVEMKFARKLSTEEIEGYKGPVHYLPHHGVVRPDSKSTPLRVVFNSSSDYQGHKLNEYWHKGPDLLNNLFGIITRFRENEVAFCGDISKMYHRILIPERDQHVHRFLWRNVDQRRPPDVYLKTVLTFGDKPAPAMAQIALQKTAKCAEEEHPEAARCLLENTYMDDICDSVASLDVAEQRTREIDEILQDGGFKVKKWTLSYTNGHENDSNGFVQVDEKERVLGIGWDQIEDNLFYKVNPNKLKQERLTKRTVLSQLSKIFDPIGLAAPVIIRTKIAMQRLWQLGVDWDCILPEMEQIRWNKLFKEIELLNVISFPRCLKPQKTEGTPPQLIVCADASLLTFGACAYLRWKVSSREHEMRLIAAKSRVAPLKSLTIPRLELQAAVMAVRLSSSIRKEIRLEIESTRFMTDSQIVLHWIKGSASRYRPFVSNRISEIQAFSEQCEWKFIPGNQNPADDVSRGLAVDQLNGRWFKGPEFMTLPEEQWPENTIDTDINDIKEELKNEKVVLSCVAKDEALDCKRFSEWRRLV